MLKRWLWLTLAVGLVLGVSSFLVFAFEPKTLAKRTAKFDDATITFRLTDDDGTLYASATEQKARSVTRLGTVGEIGVDNPWIDVDPRSDRVTLHVGSATLWFDPATRSFVFP
ncbi:MAG: hypothetical protein K8U03_17620 [Planctomycetia bacterium]|nr:hypothetical protein [Planctomycetia bacterium]